MDLIRDFWAIIGAALGGMAWLIRLEGKVSLNAAMIARLEVQRHQDLQAAKEARDATNDALREVRGDLAEIRGDIKQLLRQSK